VLNFKKPVTRKGKKRLKCRWQPSIFSTVKKETLEYDMPFSTLLLLEGITVALATTSDSGFRMYGAKKMSFKMPSA